MSDEHNDKAARLAALDPATSFIVQAPAGSGKTELLIRRYLTLLARVEQPEEIVAITFTRKAANEMRARVTEALVLAGNESDPSDADPDPGKHLAKAVISRDAEQGWELIDNPGRMQIQTIDALSARLTRSLPLLSRFGVQPETTADARELYAEAARQTVATLEDKRWRPFLRLLLAHIDNDVGRLEDLIATMLGKRDQWLRHVHSGASRASLEEAIANATIGELNSLIALIPDDSARELIVLGSFAAQNLIEEEPDNPLCVLNEIQALPGAEPEMLPHWRAFSDLLLTTSGHGSWRKKMDKRLGFPAAGAGRDAQQKSEFTGMKQRHTALVQRLTEIEGLFARLAGVRNLPPPHYTDQQWQVLEALFEVLQLAAGNLWLGFGSHGKIDFQGVSGAALQALGGLDDPSDLALALDYRISHILVDEFQDTSVTQYELLARLSAGWGPDDGHSLFLVGDPMQSIYRFREAEVGLFLRTLAARRLAGVPLTALSLSRNFRSRPGLVNWVNSSFAAIFPSHPDLTTGAVDFAASSAARPANEIPNVVVHPILTPGGETEELLAQIAAIKETSPGETIALLVRSRRHLTALVAGLHRAGLRYRAVEIDTLGQRASVQDLLALTRALLHPADRVAWLAVLRAPWCGLTLRDLEIVAGADRAGETVIWDCMHDLERVARLSEPGFKSIQRLRNVFATALNERCRLPLARWVEGVWIALGGPATVEYPEDLANARTYFELLAAHESCTDLHDIAGLADLLTDLYAAPDLGAGDELQIMTLHKAKGLQFDHVIIPGLGRSGRGDDKRLLAWIERAASDGRDELIVAPIMEVGGDRDPTFDFIASLESQRAGFEEARLLYVGATRARESLHLFGEAKVKEVGNERIVVPTANSLLATLWPAVAADFEAVLTTHEINEPEVDYQAASAGIRRLSPDWQLPPRGDELVWNAEPTQPNLERQVLEFQWASPVIRHVGTVVHLLLQRIAQQGLDHWSRLAGGETSGLEVEIARHLSALGVAAADMSNALSLVQTALNNTLADERGRWLLGDTHQEPSNEYRISGVEHGQIVNVRIDRSFIDLDEQRWIIDYKTSAHRGGDREGFLDNEQERYREQLEGYARIVSALDSRSIRCGLYFPLLGGWREWRPALS